MKKTKIFSFIVFLASMSLLANTVFAGSLATDTGYLGNDQWVVRSDGDLEPMNDSTNTIGNTGAEVANIYADAITVGGSTITSAGQVAGAWTDGGLTTTLNAAPTKFIATASSGDMYAVGFTVGTGEITMENGQTISGTTNNAVTFGDNSDTATMTFSGNDVVMDTSDGGYIFNLTDASDGSLDVRTNNDSDDYVSFTTVANVPTIVTAGTSNLVIAPDGGTTTVTGALTASGLATSAGLTTSTTITLQNSETIVNSTNGTVSVTGTANPILNVLDAGTSDSDAMLSLSADAAADNGDVWRFTSDGGTNSLFFENNTSGSQATIMTLSKLGLLTLTGSLAMADAEILSNASDAVILTGDDNDTAFRVLGFEAKEARLQLNADQDDDATDGWEIASSVTGTLTIGNDSSAAGTYLDKLTLSSAGVITLVDGETITNASDVTTLEADDAAASFVISGFEASASGLTIQSDQGDDAEDKFVMTMDAADLMTLTTGAVTAATVSTAGLWTMAAETVTGATLLNGTVGLGDAVTDVVTVTGKVAGATPLSFDGTTANTVYTILAVDDPASSSKTVTLPAVTGTIKLTGAAVALTPSSAVTLTVAKGTTLYTDTITTDNEDQTITFSGAGAAGDEVTIIFATDGGAGDEVITFHGTLVSSTGTLTLAGTASRFYSIRFISNGSHWYEVSRTAIQT